MSFPRYPKYKDSGVEWLAELPEHWDVTRLGFLCDKIGSGKTPLGGSETYTDEGVVFIRSQNVYDEGLLMQDVVYITPEIDKQMQESRVCDGDVLLNITGASLGRTCLVPSGFAGGNVNQHVCIIRVKDVRTREFVAMSMKSHEVKAQIEAAQTGAAREGLNFAQISKLALMMPPACEQALIAEFLKQETAKIDKLVADQRRLIELLREKRQAVISYAVTKGLNPNAPMKLSDVEWLGNVPEHWEVTRLGNLFREVADAGNEELPVLSVSIHHGVSDTELDEDELDRKVTRSDDRSKYKHVLPGDLVYNMMRAWQGAFGGVVVEGMVSPAYVVARARRQLSTTYVEHLLRTPQAIEEMRRRSHGVTDFRLRLYWDEFKDIKIALPPQNEAIAICRAHSVNGPNIRRNHGGQRGVDRFAGRT